jgi:hypothetical protein
MKNKKYYILYKAIKDEEGQTIDCSYNYEFSSYKEICSYLKCNNRDIKTMINNNIDKLENINLFKNKYFIIKE